MACFSWISPRRKKAQAKLDLNEGPIAISGGIAGMRERMAEMGHVGNVSECATPEPEAESETGMLEGAGYSVSADLATVRKRKTQVDEFQNEESSTSFVVLRNAEKTPLATYPTTSAVNADGVRIMEEDQRSFITEEIKSAHKHKLANVGGSRKAGKRRSSELFSEDLQGLLSVYHEEQLMMSSCPASPHRSVCSSPTRRPLSPCKKQEPPVLVLAGQISNGGDDEGSRQAEHEAPVYHELAQAYGNGLSCGLVGEKGEVFVAVPAACTADLLVEVKNGRRTIQAEGVTRDPSSGVYSCYYVPIIAGDSQVHVTLGGRHVPRSPFNLEVLWRENKVQVYYATTHCSIKGRADTESLDRLLKAKKVHLRPNVEPWLAVDLMDRDEREAVFLLAGTRSLPMVLVNGKHVGDYARLAELEEAGQLDFVLGLSDKDMLSLEPDVGHAPRRSLLPDVDSLCLAGSAPAPRSVLCAEGAAGGSPPVARKAPASTRAGEGAAARGLRPESAASSSGAEMEDRGWRGADHAGRDDDGPADASDQVSEQAAQQGANAARVDGGGAEGAVGMGSESEDGRC